MVLAIGSFYQPGLAEQALHHAAQTDTLRMPSIIALGLRTGNPGRVRSVMEPDAGGSRGVAQSIMRRSQGLSRARVRLEQRPCGRMVGGHVDEHLDLVGAHVAP